MSAAVVLLPFVPVVTISFVSGRQRAARSSSATIGTSARAAAA